MRGLEEIASDHANRAPVTGDAPFTSFGEASDELSRLKKLLVEKDQSLLRANLSEAESKQRLAEAQQEVDRLRASVMPGSVSEETHLAEIARLNSEWQRTLKSQDRQRSEVITNSKIQTNQYQQDLERERRAHRMESAQSSARIAHLEKSLAEALATISQSREAAPAKRVPSMRFVAIATGLVVACALGMWAFFHAKVPAIAAAPPSESPAVLQNLQRGVEKGFSGGLGRLNSALNSFPGRRPEEVLRAVHKQWAKTDPSVCSFQWNNGQPALLFRLDGKKLSMAETLNQCAQAVEKFR